jgi:ferredoxin
MRNLRRIVQIFFLLLFIFLIIQTEYKGSSTINYPVKKFLDLDPLIPLTSILAARGLPSGLPKALFWSLLVVGITLLFGRLFCGWICPMGTVHHAIGWLKKRKVSQAIEAGKYTSGQRWKYLLLIGLLISSLFTLQIIGLLDPLCLLIRSTAISVNPAVNYLIRGAFDALYYTEQSWITIWSEAIYNFLKDFYLSFNQPHFRQALIIGLIFLSVLLLNLKKSRFWCRYICPLGALLGLLSGISLLRLRVNKDKCTRCNLCQATCPGAFEGEKELRWRATECTVCWNCISDCPQKAIEVTFPGFKKKEEPYIDLSRRKLITAGVTGLAGVGLFKVGSEYKSMSHTLIRPPGALEEKEFLNRCIRCGECMKVCLTNVIQPSLFEAGLEGLWTPILAQPHSYCEYYCTLCGQVCPTGAIKRLSPEEKAQVKIGTAFIDEGRCIPYALGMDCVMCEEVCPTPKKAIFFVEREMVNYKEEWVKVRRPQINPELCVGCGICSYKCPVAHRPAIYVQNTGQTRQPESKMLL